MVRSGAARLVEVPYRFDDRELGDSKMSTREASGYLFQLRDLYWLRLTGPRQAPRYYQKVSAGSMPRR